MKEKFSRRALLKSLGVGAAMLPILNSEWAFASGPQSMSAPGGFPKRLITIAWTNGVYGAGGSRGPWFTPGALTNLPPIFSALTPYASKMLIPRGVNLQKVFDKNNYGGHFGFPCMLTGTWNAPGSSGGATANGPSIDVTITKALHAQNLTSRQLNLGCRPYGSFTSWAGANQPNTQITDPYALFTSLFSGANMSTTQISAIQARRQSVLDGVLGQLTAFQGVVGTDDKMKIQAHLDAVRTLEMDITAPQVTSGCAAPKLTPAGLSFSPIANFPSHVNFMMRLAAAAVTCGISRAITIDLINDGGGDSLTFPWINVTSDQYHHIAHAGATAAMQKTAIDTWWYSQVATLVSALAASTEGSSTALDNSVVMVGNDMEEGDNHYSASIPFVLIGSGGGFFKTGQVVGLNKAPNNQLLASVCHAMGVGVANVGDTYTGDLDASLT